MSNQSWKWIVGLTSGVALVLFYMFQRTNVSDVLGIANKTTAFVVSKTFRFVVNDVLMIGVIYALFGQKRFVYFALLVQVAGIVFLLVPYFILKLYFHANNGPLVSFLHRLVLNPTLMMLLIPAFWLQSRKNSR
jgi:exosortase F-associated protein